MLITFLLLFKISLGQYNNNYKKGYSRKHFTYSVDDARKQYTPEYNNRLYYIETGLIKKKKKRQKMLESKPSNNLHFT